VSNLKVERDEDVYEASARGLRCPLRQISFVELGGSVIEEGSSFLDYEIEDGGRLGVCLLLYPGSLSAAKELADRLGIEWGGTGSFANKGCYAYPRGVTEYAGTAWWGTGGSPEDEMAPLIFRPTYKMLDEEEDTNPTGTPSDMNEARSLSERLGYTWGGAGAYLVKGPYVYPRDSASEHAGTAWWGTGGTPQEETGLLIYRPTYAVPPQ